MTLLLLLFFAVVTLIISPVFNEHCSSSEYVEKKPGISYTQVCMQLMEVTARMTYNQGVEKWIIHVV